MHARVVSYSAALLELLNKAMNILIFWRMLYIELYSLELSGLHKIYIIGYIIVHHFGGVFVRPLTRLAENIHIRCSMRKNLRGSIGGFR